MVGEVATPAKEPGVVGGVVSPLPPGSKALFSYNQTFWLNQPSETMSRSPSLSKSTSSAPSW